MAPSASVLIFRRLNAKTKKDAYPLPRMQETMESMVGAWHFFLHGPEEWFLAGEDVRESLQVYCPSPWEAWVCMNSSVCRMDCVMRPQCSRG